MECQPGADHKDSPNWVDIILCLLSSFSEAAQPLALYKQLYARSLSFKLAWA